MGSSSDPLSQVQQTHGAGAGAGGSEAVALGLPPAGLAYASVRGVPLRPRVSARLSPFHLSRSFSVDSSPPTHSLLQKGIIIRERELEKEGRLHRILLLQLSRALDL